ncbi:MAG: hypothetical protein PUK70_04185 [Bacteroidales bacterium]|nr:hypothetical protein [Bacteroidales bacterium]MDY6001678.1 hypothetical protein [Candidatus Cryptobacteroides sp.]
MKNILNKQEGLLGQIITTMMGKGQARLSAWGFGYINADRA